MRRAAGARRISLSLTNRLVLVFSAITFAAIAVLYLYVAPGLQTRLLSAQLTQLASDAKGHSTVIAQTVGSSEPLPRVQDHVNAAALATGDRVTLLLVNLGREQQIRHPDHANNWRAHFVPNHSQSFHIQAHSVLALKSQKLCKSSSGCGVRNSIRSLSHSARTFNRTGQLASLNIPYTKPLEMARIFIDIPSHKGTEVLVSTSTSVEKISALGHPANPVFLDPLVRHGTIEM